MSQFDLSDSDVKKAKWYAERRQQLRHEFQKQYTNPFRHATSEGGAVDDPAIVRFMSARVTTLEHFQPTPKNVRFGLLWFALPMAATIYMFKTDRESHENLYRSGQVAYKDRKNKFI